MEEEKVKTPEPKAEEAPKEGEEVKKDAPIEEKKEEPKKEEPKKEEPKAEKLKEEEPKAEEPKEEPKEEEKPKEEPKEAPKEEALSKDIKQTKDELGVIQEVRDELVALYAQNQDITAGKEQLSKDVDKFKKELKDTKEQLSRYQDADKKMKLKQRDERLEKLSKKFGILGQDKTVEQLSKKDDETLMEFEKIVDAALDKSGDTKPLPEVTSPSQAPAEAAKEVLSEEEKSKEETPAEPGKASEQLKETNSQFFERMCKTLSNEQLSEGTRKARLL